MDRLIFVYNADSGLVNGIFDTGRRILQPSDYPCALCKVTYGPFGMKRDWKAFIETLPYHTDFLHKDEFRSAYPDVAITTPSLIRIESAGSTLLLYASDFATIKSLTALKTQVTNVLKTV